VNRGAYDQDRVSNTGSAHTVEVETNGRRQSIDIAPKSVGRGSSINGGELLFAALATCFCNDVYREAAKRGINVQAVKVEVTGTFGNPGQPARGISYRVQVHADAPQAVVDDLVRTTDAVTESQTLFALAAPYGYSHNTMTMTSSTGQSKRQV
jgi:uncharacterized OsmC-like protein